MRHVSRTHRVALDWLFDRINLEPKIQIKHVDTKNQLADILTKEIFTRDEWNHLLCLFNISHFSSTTCAEVMSKRRRKNSGEERVTAKSKSMMNLVSRCSERTPDVLASLPQEVRGQSDMKVNFLWARELSSIKEQGDLFLTLTHQVTYSGMLTKNGLLKIGNLMNWWKLDQGDLFMNIHPPDLFTEHTDMCIIDDDDMDSDTVAEADMSLLSRLFLHMEIDRVR